jgi:LacI family transcriptional regulator
MARAPQPGQRKPVTLFDVARAAGVSQSTASRVINGSQRVVNEELQERVLSAATKLNYTANLSAQTVARGKSTTVALLVSDIADGYFSSMAAAVMRAAEAHGLRVTIAVTERNVEREIELVRELRGQHARAIILAGSGYLDAKLTQALVRELQMFEDTGGTVVLVSRSNLPFAQVDLDNLEGARRLAAALVRLGYQSFTVLGAERTLVATHDRVQGFRLGLEGHGIMLRDDQILYSNFSWEGGFDAIQAMDESALDATELIFAVNDEMALGAIAGLRERGMRVPDDVAIAGFDDIRSLRNIVPSLTTVRVPVDEVGRQAIARAVEDGGRADHKVVNATVVLRDSTPRRR